MLSGVAYASQSVELSNTPNEFRLLDSKGDGLSLELNVGTVQFTTVQTKEGSFTLMTADKLGRSYNTGEPNLPRLRKLIAIPEGCVLKAHILARNPRVIHRKSLLLE